MATLSIAPLTPTIGAEIAGVDLSQALDAETRSAIATALGEHMALVFHDQTLTPE